MCRVSCWTGVGSMLLVGALGVQVLAGPNEPIQPSGEHARLLSLHGADAVPATFAAFRAQDDASGGMGAGYDLSGPYFLRSADPVALGEAEIKFEYRFTANGDHEDEADEHEARFVFEWGMAENIEFILEIEAELFEGGIDGNADIEEIGFHIRHWEQDGWHPAFATRHLVRLPTGYQSDGVDYTLRGLFTWDLGGADSMRLHFNPYLTSRNGNFDDDDDDGSFGSLGFGDDDGDGDERRFLWGAAIGFDWQLTDDMVFILDYQNRLSVNEGDSNQHVIELGGEWEFAEHQKFGWQAEFGIDGDDVGGDIGGSISYILEIGLPGLGS